MNKVSVILLGTILSSTAVAQIEGEPNLFDELDVDKNGELSTYEAAADAQLLEQFNQLDKNGDGRLTRQEFAAYDDGK